MQSDYSRYNLDGLFKSLKITRDAEVFGSGTSFGLCSSETNSVSSSSSGATASSMFGSSTGSSLGSTFSFPSAFATTSSLPSLFQTQLVFGNYSPVTAASPGNGDQMNMEDNMDEDPDPVQAIPVFGQPSPSPTGLLMFGSTASSPSPSPTLPCFQFELGGQRNQATPHNPSPFRAWSSLDFGTFSLGSGGGDKSTRKILRVHKNRFTFRKIKNKNRNRNPISPPPAGFMFGSTSTPPSPAFHSQFGRQQNQAPPQNPSPFQASSSTGGGSFSLGSGGGDKSNRKIVRVDKTRNRKK